MVDDGDDEESDVTVETDEDDDEDEKEEDLRQVLTPRLARSARKTYDRAVMTAA